VVREQAERRRTKDPATGLLLYYLPDLFLGVKFLETNSMGFFFCKRVENIFLKIKKNWNISIHGSIK
jgi:hypothetical protein